MTGVEMFAKQLLKLLGIKDTETLALAIVKASGIPPEAAMQSFERITSLPAVVISSLNNFDQRLANIEATQLLICEKMGIAPVKIIDERSNTKEVSHG